MGRFPNGVRRRAPLLPILAAAGFLALAPPAGAQQPLPGDPARGAVLAGAWCAECHDVGQDRQARPTRATPGFRQVAKDPAFSEPAFRSFLQTTHGGMPDIRLSAEQAGDLIAYLMVLRDTPPGSGAGGRFRTPPPSSSAPGG